MSARLPILGPVVTLIRPRDSVAFARACQALAAEALCARVPGLLPNARGEVLAEVDYHGRCMAAPSITGSSEPSADSCDRTAEVVCYVHNRRLFSPRCGEPVVAPFCATGGE